MSAASMRVELVPLSECARWPRNPKLHDLPLIRASLRRFGFVAPIVEDGGSGKLVAGHGRLEALIGMRDDGEEPPDRIRADDGDWLVPVLRGVSFASEAEAEAYLVADNRLVELGGWDEAKLLAMFDGMEELGERALDGVGWTDDQVRTMRERAAAGAGPGTGGAPPAPAAPPDDFQSYDENLETQHRCEKCGYEWSGGE